MSDDVFEVVDLMARRYATLIHQQFGELSDETLDELLEEFVGHVLSYYITMLNEGGRYN